MAMRHAAVFATEAQLWVNLQAQHDLWIVSQKKPPSVKPLRQAA
jgi:plasmid maintenance system antidote protein VapI